MKHYIVLVTLILSLNFSLFALKKKLIRSCSWHAGISYKDPEKKDIYIFFNKQKVTHVSEICNNKYRHFMIQYAWSELLEQTIQNKSFGQRDCHKVIKVNI